MTYDMEVLLARLADGQGCAVTYSTAQKNAAATELIKQLPGMHYRIARVWVTAEAGLNNNVLGVKIQNVLQKYPTMEAGIAAAAEIIKRLQIYAPIRASLKRGTHDMQATAICHSPWHSGVWGLREQGGLDKYYARIFRGAGYNVD